MGGSSILQLLVSAFILCSFFQKPAYAIRKSYIAYLGSHPHGPKPSSADLKSATNSHYNLLGSILGSHEKAKEAILYSYNRHINGFAAILDEEEAAEIAKNPNVVSVIMDKVYKLHTTRSWQFLGLEGTDGVVAQDSAWERARYGADTIIANLDSGVWPESKSFSDEGMGPIPSKWRGICQLDNFRCNRKLIGARFFNKGYKAAVGTLNESFNNACDMDGHGSHTLSTAGGNFVPRASVFGYGNGTAMGGSPRARVAAYRVCGVMECFSTDILAGFEAAISDGVDVVSVSLGGRPEKFHKDALAIGSFHAVSNGLVVVASAGNSGPQLETVTNESPWLITVAASKIDREFNSYVVLGDGKVIKGASLSSSSLPSEKFYPLISAEDANHPEVRPEVAKYCFGKSLDPKKVKGKILVCLPEGNITTEKGEQALLAGAVGMILANDDPFEDDLTADAHVLPASSINSKDSQYVYSYIKNAKKPKAYLTQVKQELGIKPAPIMVSFSSRGPSTTQPSILKPDITAPGLNILAAFSEAASPSSLHSDKRRVPFIVMSGTSMSCPHVAGVAALLKTRHPHWSSAAIKSAIMTTASTQDNRYGPILDTYLEKKATAFVYGAGHIQPNLAIDPGLVYDLETCDYLNLLCASNYSQEQIRLIHNKTFTCPKSYKLADFNYPSITVLDLDTTSLVSLSRTVTNVGTPSTYNVEFKAPEGVSIMVWPSSLTFKEVGEKKKFEVFLSATGAGEAAKEYVFGELCWSDGKHKVRSPIVVKHSKKGV